MRLTTAAENSGAMYWSEDGVGYVLSGPVDKDRLNQVRAGWFYDQTEKKPPAELCHCLCPNFDIEKSRIGNMRTSQYRTKHHAKIEDAFDSRRSTAAASIGVCRAGPPVEAALFFYFCGPLIRPCTISGGALRSSQVRCADCKGCSVRAHFCINASSSASFPSGSIIRMVTNRSPCHSPSLFGSPLPFRRKGAAASRLFFGIDNSTGATQSRHANFCHRAPPHTSVIGRSTRAGRCRRP